MEQNELSSPSPNSQSLSPNRKFQYLALALLLGLYLMTAGGYAALAPLTTGPDELAHYEYLRFIAEHGRLPINNEERAQASYKSDQPPVYHLLAALPASLVDSTGPPFLKRVSDHPRRQLIERTRHAWGLYNTEDERWPYRAEVLRWQVGRWVAILFGAATVALTFFVAREVFVLLPLPFRRVGKSTWLPALAAAATVAFIPRYGLTGSMLNYETTAAFFTALFLGVLVRIANERIPDGDRKGGRSAIPDGDRKGGRSAIPDGDRKGGRSAIPDGMRSAIMNNPPLRFRLYVLLLGLFAGLAILTKLSALVLPLEALLALGLIGRYQGWSRSTWLKTWLSGLGVTTLVVSFWLGFVLYQFNTVATEGLWVGFLRPLVAADSSDATTNKLLNLLTGGQAGFTGAIDNLESGPPWEWARIFFRTFWMVGIETVQPLTPWALPFALALCLMAAGGLALAWHYRHREPVAEEQGPPSLLPTAYSLLPTPVSRLLLLLLLLHVVTPLFLPWLRYMVTFSLADTAQGRHLLFPAAPALACLLIWGLLNFSFYLQRPGANPQRAKSTSLRPTPPKKSSIFNLQSLIPSGIPDGDRKGGRSDTFDVSRLIMFVPGLFLLLWTAAHLWTMTWAYNPPLPVSTLPEAGTQAAHPLDHPFNKFVTLAGYTSRIDPGKHGLQLELFWQAKAVSPVDYLTEVSLRNPAGELQAQWLGYPAGGRYPTRAWDVGDTLRDTVWLPLAGLPEGTYQLSLNLVPTSRLVPPEAGASPLVLTEIKLVHPAVRVFNHSLPFTGAALAAGGYSVWQNGEALTVPQPFRYRETVLVTLSPLLPNQQRTVRMVGPDPHHPFSPRRELNDTALFIVGPDWPSGDYHLQVTMTSPGEADSQLVNSNIVLRVNDLWQRQFDVPPISHPVEANFSDQIKLLGYDLGANRAEPGGGLPLTLYWQGLDWIGPDYTIFTKLLAADQTVHGGRDRLPREGYRPIYWAPGEIVTDPFGVPVDPTAPAGVYYINVGLYQQVDRQAVSLPLVQEGQPIEVSSINIGPIKVGGPPPGLTHQRVSPQYPLNQPFGDTPNITLLGYDINNCQLSIDNCQLALKLYWRSESPLPADYTTFVHLRNAAGETVAQKDQPPLNGAYPTSLWDPGEIIADPLALPLPAGLPAGEYQLVVGWYDLVTGARLTTPGSLDNSILLRKVTVSP